MLIKMHLVTGLVQFKDLMVAIAISILTTGSIADFVTANPAYAQGNGELEYEMVQGSYENRELGFSLVLPDSMDGFVYEYEYAGTKGLTMQIHPEFDSSSAPCCPAIETSPVVFLLRSDSLDMLLSPDSLSGDIYAAFQGYNMRMSIEELGDNQVLAATMYSNNDRVGLDYIKHVGKFYLMNNEERFLSYGLWATEENYQKYLDEFEESAKSLSIENAKSVDLHSLFSRYAYSDIELPLNEGPVRPEIITPSIIDFVAVDEDSNTISMNVTEPTGNSFLILNSGNLIIGPHSITLDGEPIESTTLRNENGEYLIVFYDQVGNHQVAITGTAIVPEFGSIATLLTAAGIVGAVAMTKYLRRQNRKS